MLVSYLGGTRKTISVMQLYERNYLRLQCLVPDIKLIGKQVEKSVVGTSQLKLSGVEQFKYTSVISLIQPLSDEDVYLADPRMDIRVYHDARVAEVLSFQNHGHFRPKYDYPNPCMYQPREKKRVNLFLSEWLDFLIQEGHRFASHGDHSR